MAELHGACDERFDAVYWALAESLDKDDVGASAAVFLDGEPVVDLWGGHVDAARTLPWERDTITCVWSVTKTMMALCALILAVRYGMGYGIFDRLVGWGGWGGSLVMVDLDARMAVSYVMNQMLDHSAGSYRGLGIVIAAHEGLRLH